MESYASYDSIFNKKLKVDQQRTEYYGANDFHEALELLGVSYKRDYNGYSYNSLTSYENGIFLKVSGMSNKDFPNLILMISGMKN